jgi:hypothetical protein
MTGPDHYAEAERLLALAERHSTGATYGPAGAAAAYRGVIPRPGCGPVPAAGRA